MTKATAFCVLAVMASGCGGGDARPSALPKVAGVPKENSILRLEAFEAGFFPAGAPSPGRRYYTVGLRGMSRSASGQLLGQSKGDDVVIDVKQFVFAQNDRGCISRAETAVSGVTNLFGDAMTFGPGRNTEGRLVFVVPDDTKQVRVVIAPAGTDGLTVPAGDDFAPSWPEPLDTIVDGTTMKILVLPRPPAPAGLPPAAAGKDLVVLDVVVQNLSSDHGIEFQPSQQLRLMDPAGTIVQASPATQQLGCRMDDGDLIPPGQSRRVIAVYEMPAGSAPRLHYRGFETQEAIVPIR